MKNRSLGIALSYGNTLLSMLCGLMLSSVLLRSLGDVEYGLYQTVSSFAMYLVMLEFGTGTAMSRGIVIYRNSNKVDRLNNCIATVWYMTVALAGLIIIVSAFFYFNIETIYSNSMNPAQISYAKKLFIIITGYLVFNYFRQAMNGVLLGMEQYIFHSIMNIAQVTSRTVMLVSLMYFAPYADTVVSVDFILSIICFCVTFLYCRKNYKLNLQIKYFDRNIVVEFFPLCFALLLQSFVNQANNNVDKFVIGIQMNMVSVAVYSVAQYIYSIFASVTTVPISMYLPQIGKDIARGLEGKELTDTMIEPSRFVSLLGGSIIFGFIAVGRQFISIFYGESKVEAWSYALIILVPMFINMTNGIVVNVLDIKNKRQVRSIALACTTVLNIILTIWFIPIWGIIGAVIATAIATTIGQVLFMNFYYQKKLNIKVLYLFRKAYHGIILFQIIACAISVIVSGLMQSDLSAFLVGGTLYLLISGGLIVSFGLNSYERERINSLINKWI